VSRSVGVGRFVEGGLVSIHFAVECKLRDCPTVNNRTVMRIEKSKRSYCKGSRHQCLGHSSSTATAVNTEAEFKPHYSYLSPILIGPELGLEHLVHHLIRFLLGIFFPDACEHQQTLADCGDQFRVDTDRGRLDSLDHDYCGFSWSTSRTIRE
jgi:hypothetical protein